MSSWDVAVYERYRAYRDRPALDLLLRLPGGLSPKSVWDLGCGDGEHAALLARRYPNAVVHGLDSSPDMLDAARRRREPVAFIQGDIEDFAPDAPVDLIFTNAALHWVDHHAALLPRLAAALAPGGVLACQMPLAHDSPHHRLIRQVATDGPWSQALAQVRGPSPGMGLEDYYDALSPICSDLDLWTTRYLHVLEGEDPVIDWLSGAGLRPYLDALQGETRLAFLQRLREGLARIYPQRANGVTLLPFERLFIVAIH